MVGGGHSSNGCYDPLPGGTLIAMDNLKQILSVDATNMRVTMQAGAKYSDVDQTLKNTYNFSVPMLPSFESLCPSGGQATGAHGNKLIKTNKKE